MIGGKRETVEEHLERWAAKHPSCRVSDVEYSFIAFMRSSAARGVGYGWMMQIIEMEWASKSPGAWGPEYYLKQVLKLEEENKALKAELTALREKA